MSFINKYQHHYPGHALVIAACIMEKYPSFAAASNRPAKSPGGKLSDYPEALGSSDIPGAGGNVYSALHVLSMNDIEQAIEYANECWRGECSGCYANRFEEGMQAAQEVESFVRKMWLTWKR